MRGVVARVVTNKDTGARKGFGFITSGGVDYFFHATGMEQTTKTFADVNDGDQVEFTHIQGDKGPKAIEVRVVA